MWKLHQFKAVHFQTVVLALVPRTLVLNICKSFAGIPWSTCQKLCSGMTQGCQGPAVALIRGVDVPGTVFWHDTGSPRRNSPVDSWC
eukprot:9489954-Pyramimonas_sp.AAC.1